jgi:hypothetical protein
MSKTALAKTEESTALATIADQYPVLDPSSEAAELIRFNMGNEGISVADLDRIKVPTGGGVNWEIPSLSGAQSARFIDGILIHISRRRAYWSNPNPTGDPPDCASVDMEIGVGNPGGDCSICPLNQWGSAKDQSGAARAGKACRECLLTFVLRPGATLPVIISVPPSSLDGMRKYRLRLSDSGKKFFQVVTRFSLNKTSSKTGVAYSEIVPEIVSEIDAETSRRVEAYARSIVGSLEEAATKVVQGTDA